MAERGIHIHYLAGNHDFRLAGFLESEIGMMVHADDLAADLDGQPVYIFHGDGILARDYGYRFLKKVLRARWAQRTFRCLHPDFGMRLARGTSITSRAMTRVNPNDDLEYLNFAKKKIAEGYRGVILGHTHRPVEYTEDGGTYVNLGDWIEHFSYGLHDGGRLSLQHFDT